LRLRVLAAGGPNGMPGTTLREVVRGSIGNIIGGFPAAGAYMARIMLQDDSLPPLILNSDFYLAVQNSGLGVEAFGLDTSSTFSGRSVLFDGCAGQWYSEDGTHEGTHRGNRMIRARGWQDTPVQLVITRQNNDVVLNWSASGGPYYKIYRSLSSDSNAPQFLASVSDTTYIDQGEVSAQIKAFYLVVSSSLP